MNAKSTNTIWCRATRKRLIEERGGHCQWDGCQATSSLEFAHVKHTDILQVNRGRGSFPRIKDVRDNPEAYKLWCHTHHVQYDFDQRHPEMKET
jgi:hypothetical protein